MVKTPKPIKPSIGVIILDFEGGAKDALSYLVTHLNVLQKAIEFQLVPLCPGTALEASLKRDRSDHRDAQAEAENFRILQTAVLRRLDMAYDLSGEIPKKFIIVCLTAWTDNYYSIESDGIAVIALGHWQKQMSPPSAVEIALSAILVAALRIALPSAPNSHMGTKGCLFDFNAAVSDIRLKVLNAHICDDCCRSFAAGGNSKLASDLASALDGKWLGSLDDEASPASICRKLGYDLFRTKGLTPTFWETLLEILRTESAKTIVQILTTITIGLLGISVLAKG